MKTERTNYTHHDLRLQRSRDKGKILSSELDIFDRRIVSEEARNSRDEQLEKTFAINGYGHKRNIGKRTRTIDALGRTASC